MQKIDIIEIKNFKSISHQKIEGCKRINVFIGYPNVGKSNILEALSLFSIDEPDADFSSFVRAEELTTLFFDGNVNEEIEISINNENRMIASLSESNKEIRFDWQLSGDGASFEKMGPGVQQPIFHMLSFYKTRDINIISKWDSIFKRQARSNDFYKELGKGYLASIKKYSFQRDILYSSNKYDSLSVANGENLFDIIYTHPEIRREIASLFESYNLKLLYNSTEKKFSILKSLSDEVIFTIPYGLVADTLQRLIFYKTAILSNKNSILLFEEPEAHMFPPYISKFTNDVIYDENKNQFFITTHSPFVLNDFMDNLKSDELAIYIVSYKKQTGETQIHRMNEEDMHEAYQFGYDFFMNIDKFISQKQHGEV